MKNKILTLVLVAVGVFLLVPDAVASQATVQAAAQVVPKDAKIFIAQDKVFLHDSAIVNGKIIRLGDLFANIGDKAEITVAYAPEPGKRATFDASWLYRVARAYKLAWRPLSNRVRIIVERDSIVINREEIEDHILARLIEKDVGVDMNMNMELSNRMLRIYVASDAEASLAIEDINYEPRTKRVTAIIRAPANDPAAQRMRVTGRVYKTSEVPVFTRRMLTGELIGPRDIEWIKMRANRLQPDIILNVEDLIGKAPRRSLRSGSPIRTSDVRRPVMVPRGSLVTMVLRMPDMVLTAKGKALDEGSDGDTIRVVNSQSNTVVESVVTGANMVAVMLPSRIAMN